MKMKKIGIIVGVIILVMVSFVLVKDAIIKKELSKVAETQVVETSTNKEVFKKTDSTITLQRKAGVWTASPSGIYAVDLASLSLEFVGYKPGGEHTGTFNNLSGEISLDPEGNPLQAQIILEVNSVKTDAAALDKHLQAPEFFNAAKYDVIEAFIKEIKFEPETKLAVVDLTMKGITKTLIVPIVINSEADLTAFEIDTRVNIKDYNIAYGPVLNEVRIMLRGKILKK